MNFPKRTPQHNTETDSLTELRVQLGSNWLFRDQSERDYGIDIHLEYYDDTSPTGLSLYGQVKGTRESFLKLVKLNGFSTKTANYANLFNIPFFVFYVSLADKKIKFIWLQEYLRLKVRSASLLEQESITIEFPLENNLDEENGLRKILTILQRERLAKASLMFLTYYERLLQQFEELRSEDIPAGKFAKIAKSCLVQVCEIQRLKIIPNPSSDRDGPIGVFDFSGAVKLLTDVMDKNKFSIEDIKNFERLIFPLKFKKLDLLNQDTHNAIHSWLTSEKHY